MDDEDYASAARIETEIQSLLDSQKEKEDRTSNASKTIVLDEDDLLIDDQDVPDDMLTPSRSQE